MRGYIAVTVSVLSPAPQMEGALVPGYLDPAPAPAHACLRPVCGDDVPIIGRTRVSSRYISRYLGSVADM